MQSFFSCLKVVGSQARILYADQRGRVGVAEAFNKAISDKRLLVSIVTLQLITLPRYGSVQESVTILCLCLLTVGSLW